MILVVGDVMADILVRPEGQPAPGTDRAATIVRRPGGSAANIACWLGDQGMATRFAGRVGAADLATHHATFAHHGVQAHLAADPVAETGSVVALVDPDGGRSFFTDRAANLNLCAGDLPPALLDGVRALHVSGHVFFAAGPRAAATALMAEASERGIEVSIDAGSAGWLAQAGAARFLDWTSGTALCFANADEAALLGGGFPTFVVTGGAAGAEAWRGQEHAQAPAQPVSVLDGTGAGDAFAAGFLAARRNGASLADCLEAGGMVAAKCLALPGGRPP